MTNSHVILGLESDIQNVLIAFRNQENFILFENKQLFTVNSKISSTNVRASVNSYIETLTQGIMKRQKQSPRGILQKRCS